MGQRFSRSITRRAFRFSPNEFQLWRHRLYLLWNWPTPLGPAIAPI
jgi:hypothetical protein